MDPTQWWGHGFGGFMWLFPILFFVVFMFFMRGIFGRGSLSCGSHSHSAAHGDGATHDASAREILDKRFAIGDITKEEYEEMKKSLGNETS